MRNKNELHKEAEKPLVLFTAEVSFCHCQGRLGSIQYNTIQYNIIQYNIIQYNIILYEGKDRKTKTKTKTNCIASNEFFTQNVKDKGKEN